MSSDARRSATLTGSSPGFISTLSSPLCIRRTSVPAIRAASLDSPLEVDVDAPDDLTLPSPVAAALYFAVCELLANAAKHAGVRTASVIVSSDSPAPGYVEVVVRDDGAGGAGVRPGGGLDGVRRRLDVFDATLDLDSPIGGPTLITVQVPCGSF